jgi:proteasome lid subunit RPN8/RPN11
LFRELRASGESLVAIYHSHPAGEATPSPRDVAEAYHPDSAHVIVSLRDENQPEVRAFRVIDDDVTEIELHAIV